MSVLVTNAKSRIAYNIVRTLGKKGIEVHTADFVSPAMSFSSKYSTSHFIYPSPFSRQEEFIHSLIENMQRLKTQVLLPVFEETFLISKYKKYLPKTVRVVVPSYHKILFMHNKNKWANLASRLEVPMPKTLSVNSLRQNDSLLEELHYPVLLKPKQGGGGWAISEIETKDKLASVLKQKTNNGLEWDRFFVQEKIIGDTVCVAMLYCKGGYRAKVTYKQIREYPIKGGQATLRESIENTMAEEYFKAMLDSIQWHGICQADFIVDRQTRIPFLIDINPRFWGSLAQGIASGVNFPLMMYTIAKEGDVTPQDHFKTNVMSRWLGGDLRTFPQTFLAAERKWRFLKQFIVPGSGKVFHDDISLTDPMPFVTWTYDSVRKMIKNKSLTPSVHDSLEGVWD